MLKMDQKPSLEGRKEKIKLLTVPMDNYLLLVSIDELSDHVKLINTIWMV
jgi:hypothetical protein